MEVIDYYYKILDIKYDASNKEIYDSYNKKIKKYLHLPFLTDNQKAEIKELKKAKFILTDEDLRRMYDSVIIQELDEYEKVKDKSEETLNKKEKIDSQMMGNRIFSMVGVLNIPQRNYDIDRNFFKKNLE